VRFPIWSEGAQEIRARAGHARALTDDEIAATDMGGDNLIAIDSADWPKLRVVLEVFFGVGEDEGLPAAAAWLTGRGIGWSWGNIRAEAPAAATATAAGAAAAARPILAAQDGGPAVNRHLSGKRDRPRRSWPCVGRRGGWRDGRFTHYVEAS
jgi:hypothetical protein